MRTMRELLNLFVDGEVTTQEEAWELVASEHSDEFPNPNLAEDIVATATRLLPRSQAERIVKLLERN